MANRTKYTEDLFMNKRFGKLFVTGPIVEVRDSRGKLQRKVTCKCDCGNIKDMNIIQLCNGNVTSCGCGQIERHKALGEARHLGLVKSKGNTKDGRTGTRLYSIWKNMHTRCYNPNADNYKYYGGKGVQVSFEWNHHNPRGWDNFKTWSYMNGYNEEDNELEIDRIDHEGHYSPYNCRWVHRIDQVNNKSDNINITCGNITKTAAEWSSALCINREMLVGRIKHDWPAFEALSIPSLPPTMTKEQYIEEHGEKPFIIVNDAMYKAKYGKSFFDNDILSKPLPM